MWDFSVFLFLALLYPGSLLLPGVYGFAVQLVVAVFGTVVGDWVDLNPRMKGECDQSAFCTIVHGCRPESENIGSGKKGYHQKEHLKRSRMAQISAS